ncbi:MAG TPA: hypothetical protein VN653_00585 [Anaerolineales bacterium]|nr:hypothetical protein [Anaerolineales bacterium]
MDFVIEHDKDRQMIIVTASGKWELDKDNEMIRQIMKAVEESGSRKVLLDMRELYFNLPMIHLYERAQGLMQQRLNSKTISRKVALVYTAHTRKIDEDLIFFETAARNRNLPYRIFKDLEEAQQWLREP